MSRDGQYERSKTNELLYFCKLDVSIGVQPIRIGSMRLKNILNI